MARILLIQFVFISCIYFVKAESDCVAYDFENDVDSHFERNKLCSTDFSSWNVGSYSEIGIESPNTESGSFVSPASTLSCISSFDFPVTAGGVLEVNVYMNASVTNQLWVMINQIVPGGNDAVVGQISVTPASSNFVSGWQTLSTTIMGSGTFEAYITFMGVASEDSQVLIDSFRYIPPSVNVNSCLIYKEEPTTERTDGIEDCVTYNFEKDFDIRFTTDNYLCDGFVPWHLDNYTSVDVESPNLGSTVFMSPNEVSSCISSFVFKMAPGGIVEANVFMKPITAFDHIIVLAQRVTEKEYDTVAGFKMYYPENHVFLEGWNVLRFSLLDLTSFEGYLIFIGSADKNSTVLVDSVRYIPPLTPPDDASCTLY